MLSHAIFVNALVSTSPGLLKPQKRPPHYHILDQLPALPRLHLHCPLSLFLTVDCEWEYRDYEDCSATCGVGIKRRFPIITVQPQHGGRECPGFVIDGIPNTDECNLRSCPGRLKSILYTI